MRRAISELDYDDVTVTGFASASGRVHWHLQHRERVLLPRLRHGSRAGAAFGGYSKQRAMNAGEAQESIELTHTHTIHC